MHNHVAGGIVNVRTVRLSHKSALLLLDALAKLVSESCALRDDDVDYSPDAQHPDLIRRSHTVRHQDFELGSCSQLHLLVPASGNTCTRRFSLNLVECFACFSLHPHIDARNPKRIFRRSTAFSIACTNRRRGPTMTIVHCSIVPPSG